MTSIIELFPKARRLTFDLQALLQYVEKGHASPDDASMNLEELTRQLDVLESLVGQERPAQREDWRRYARAVYQVRTYLVCEYSFYISVGMVLRVVQQLKYDRTW